MMRRVRVGLGQLCRQVAIAIDAIHGTWFETSTNDVRPIL
jgi:hypothetical protein